MALRTSELSMSGFFTANELTPALVVQVERALDEDLLAGPDAVHEHAVPFELAPELHGPEDERVVVAGGRESGHALIVEPASSR